MNITHTDRFVNFPGLLPWNSLPFSQSAFKIAPNSVLRHYLCLFQCLSKGAYLRDCRHDNIVATLLNWLKYNRIVINFHLPFNTPCVLIISHLIILPPTTVGANSSLSRPTCRGTDTRITLNIPPFSAIISP